MSDFQEAMDEIRMANDLLDVIATLRRQNAALQEDAERARWCEEMKATVSYNGITQKWTVIADEPMPWRRRYFNNPDRNAAIDAARGKV